MAKSTENPSTQPVTYNKPKIIFAHGDKGGVGKSMIASAVIDYLDATGQKVAVIDADTQNPDVSRMFLSELAGASVPCMKANLRSENGWMDTMDFVTKHKDHYVVISMPAGIGEVMNTKNWLAEFRLFLAQDENPTPIELLWVLNTGLDSVNLLVNANETYGKYFDAIHVVRNNIWSNADEFTIWNKNPIKIEFEKKGWKTIDFPALNYRCRDSILGTTKTLPFTLALDSSAAASIGLKSSEIFKLKNWLEEVAGCLKPVFG